MGKLILIRHGESEGNASHIVVGITDVRLTVKGYKQAVEAGKTLNDIQIDKAYTSLLTRTKETYTGICEGLGYTIPVEHTAMLNERNWGFQEGRQMGDLAPYTQSDLETWLTYDGVVPEGESYADAGARAQTFLSNHILPLIRHGKNVIMVSHNGVLKTLRVILEKAPKNSLQNFSFQNCEIIIYQLSEKGELEYVDQRVSNL